MSNVDIALNILEKYNHVNTIKCASFEELSDVVNHGDNNFNFTILHYNIRSLQAHYDELCINLTEMNKHNKIDRYKINGFQIYYNEAKYNKCDGVVVYIRDDVSANVSIKMIGVVTALECSFTFSNKYSQMRHIVACRRYEYLAQECEYNNLRYVNMLQQNGYVSQINIQTRSLFLKASRFKTSESHLTCSPILLENCMTDHYQVLLNIEHLNKSNRVVDRSNCLLKKIDDSKLVNSLQAVNWNSIYSESDAEKATDNFYTKLQKCIDEATSYVKITNNTRKLKPWMTAGIHKKKG
nr:unnamed protein product [Callosobruchus chinensis]